MNSRQCVMPDRIGLCGLGLGAFIALSMNVAAMLSAAFAEGVPSCVDWRDCHLSRRILPSMAYDSVRGVTLLYGGDDGYTRHDLWQWDGSAWTLLSDDGPLTITNHGLAFDEARGVTVLTGGGKTYEWDGSAFTLRAEESPYSRNVVYDAAREVTMLLMCSQGACSTFDTWTWDGKTWTLAANTGPAFRFSYATAYDPVNQVVMMHGGKVPLNPGEQILNDTWLWDGQSWTQVGNGPLLADHSMVFDEALGQMVMYGGSASTNSYRWNGTSWISQATTGLQPLEDHRMVYDSKRGVIVMAGGEHFTTKINNGLTYERAAGAWSAHGPNGPNGRQWPAMAYDEARGLTVLFGGLIEGASGPTSNDTWEWDGANWVQRLIPGPPNRTQHAMCYDSARGVMVMFGGLANSSSNPLGDTWEYNGAAWQLRANTGPSPRAKAKIVYDSARGVTVLFGGGLPSDQPQTWEWDGVAGTWTLRTTIGPAQQSDHVMAYDAARGVTVLAGGPVGAVETWEWDGNAWTLRDVGSAPYTIKRAAVYDSAHGFTLVPANSGPTGLSAWNGKEWSSQFSPIAQREEYGLAYDSKHSITVMFGGHNYHSDTQELDLTVGLEIVEQPEGTSVPVFSAAQFEVVATGIGKHQYQWFKQGVPLSDDGNISGSQSAMLNIASANPGMQGSYTVQVSDANCFEQSSSAYLEIQFPLGDVTHDGFVNIDDLFELLAYWGIAWCFYCPDLNGDLVVDVDDLFILLNNWTN